MDLGANTILLTDSYKISHHLQYPPDITRYFKISNGSCFNPFILFYPAFSPTLKVGEENGRKLSSLASRLY